MRSLQLVLVLSLFTARLAFAQPAAGSAPPSALPAATGYSVATGESMLSYDIVHKLHKVRGISKKAEGKGRILPDGKVQVMIRVPVESFDSSNVNRDEHMKEVVDAARFPVVELKALGEGVSIPASFPATMDKTFKAQLSFHGQQKAFDLPVKLTFEGADRIRAQATLSVSFDEFKIERPSLLFVKVDDAIKIEANVVFNKG